jgi:hypothetical protein
VDIWVLIHEWNSAVFDAYLVSATGVSGPTVSTTGPVQQDVHGQMKFSNNGARVACIRDTVIQATNPYQGKAYLDLFDFNNQTGVVSFSVAINLNNWQKAYGVEFSPDNGKLYATYYDQSGINGGNSQVIQYNLAAANVASSGFTVGSSTDPNILRSMQQASDGKIYISKSNSPFLCVINSPNLTGAASNYSDNAVNVDPNSIGSSCMLGLPGFVQSYFHPLYPDIVTCPTNTVTNPVGISSAGTGDQVKVFYAGEKIHVSKGNLSDDVYLRICDFYGREIISSRLVKDETTAIINFSPDLH